MLKILNIVVIKEQFDESRSLLGDNWHPMTPNLGKGTCCALGDVVLLSKKLTQAINVDDTSIEESFKSYRSEREILYVHMNICTLFNQCKEKNFVYYSLEHMSICLVLNFG